MRASINRNILAISVVLLILGVLFGILENHYYQYLDANGYLHESFFLPLAAVCIAIAGLGLSVVLIKWLCLLIRH